MSQKHMTTLSTICKEQHTATSTYHFMLVLWLPVVGPVLLSFVCLVGDQHVVKEVALVHGPDLDCHSPNVTQVVQGRLVLKVVWVGDLLGLPYALQVPGMLFVMSLLVDMHSLAAKRSHEQLWSDNPLRSGYRKHRTFPVAHEYRLLPKQSHEQLSNNPLRSASGHIELVQ